MRSRFDARPQRLPQYEAGAIVVTEASAPTITKAVQGSNGYTTQDLKDAGRSALAITLEAAATSNAEALATMTISVDGAAASTFTSRAITNGKRLRFQLLSLQVEALGSGTAPQRAYLRLRSEPAGATTAASPLQLIVAAAASGTVNSARQSVITLPDGFELAGDGDTTFGFTLETPDYVAATAEVRVKASIIAFEY